MTDASYPTTSTGKCVALKARLIKNVEGLDLKLYSQVISVKRDFDKKWNAE